MLLQAMWMSVLIGVLGGLLAFLVAWNRLHAFLKPMSEVLQEKLKYISLPDHRAKTGYQNEVSHRDVTLWPPSRSTTVLHRGWTVPTCMARFSLVGCRSVCFTLNTAG